jgi:hypothetical protein
MKFTRGAGKTISIESVNQSGNRSQIATGCQKHRDPRFPPYAFSVHRGVAI